MISGLDTTTMTHSRRSWAWQTSAASEALLFGPLSTITAMEEPAGHKRPKIQPNLACRLLPRLLLHLLFNPASHLLLHFLFSQAGRLLLRLASRPLLHRVRPLDLLRLAFNRLSSQVCRLLLLLLFSLADRCLLHRLLYQVHPLNLVYHLLLRLLPSPASHLLFNPA